MRALRSGSLEQHHDPVAPRKGVDLRLFVKESLENTIGNLRDLQCVLVEIASEHRDIIMPGYTHLQRAQPMLAGHGLLAYVEMLQRDADRLVSARERVNVCPLGSGAVAGTSLPLDRKRTAELLGFPAVTRNSIDATADRDFLAEICFDCAILSVHLSRWAEDWIVYSIRPNSFVE